MDYFLMGILVGYAALFSLLSGITTIIIGFTKKNRDGLFSILFLLGMLFSTPVNISGKLIYFIVGSIPIILTIIIFRMIGSTKRKPNKKITIISGAILVIVYFVLMTLMRNY